MNGRPKIALFTHFTAVAKSLAHAHRLELLEHLAQGERSVEVLAQRTGLSVANASQHLQQMRRAGIVAARREGKFVFYACPPTPAGVGLCICFAPKAPLSI